MSEPARVAHALARAASAFWSTLLRRTREAAPVEAIPVEAVPVRKPDAPRASISSGLPTTAGVDNRCPVCQARFRGSRICSRCGADLEPLMVLTVKAWQLRQAARQALDAGDAGRALSSQFRRRAFKAPRAGRRYGCWAPGWRLRTISDE